MNSIRLIVLWLMVVMALRGGLADAQGVSVEALPGELDALIVGHATAKRTTVALKVVDLASGAVLYDRGGDKLLTPASNLKIYTTAAALDLLGPDYRHAWQMVVDRETVYVVGGGAPMIDTAELAEAAKQLIAVMKTWGRNDRELKRERKVVVVVPSSWAGLPDKGPGWMWDDEPDYYNMTITPMMLDFNTLKVSVTAGSAGEQAKVTVTPSSEYPSVQNTTVMVDDGETSTRVRITRKPFTDDVLVSGVMQAGSKAVEDTITMHDPNRWVAGVFAAMLKAEGVAIVDTAVERGLSVDQLMRQPNAKSVTNQSEPLQAALKHFNKVSENAVGEMVLLHLGEKFTEAGGEDEEVTTSWPKGAKVISDWLVDEAGLERDSFRLVDGSGLSRYNLITADSSIRLLQYMHRHEHAELFVDMLPVYRVGLPEVEQWGGQVISEIGNERVFAKPGGMSGVNTISGYLDTLDGRRLAFSFLTNGYIGSSAPSRDLRAKVWATLVRLQLDE